MAPRQASADAAGDALDVARSLLLSGRLDDALAALATVKATFPEAAAEAQKLTGIACHWKKDFAKAVAAYNEVLATYPDSRAAEETYFWLGDCYEAEGDADRAISSLEKQVALFPKSPRTWEASVKIGWMYRQRKQSEAAVAVLNKALAAYPEHAVRIGYCIGICYKDQERYADAIAALSKAATSSAAPLPSVEDSYLRAAKVELAHCYRENRDYGSAIKLYETVASEYPAESVMAGYYAGVCYKYERKYAEAVAAFAKAVASAPESLPKDDWYLKASKGERGDCYRDMGDFQAAIAVHKELAAEYPADAAGEDLAIADITLYSMGNIGPARAMLEEIERNYPGYADMAVVRYHLAWSWYAQGDYSRAARLFHEAHGKGGAEGWLPLILYMAGDACRRAGDPAGQKAAWDMLVKLYPEDTWARLAASDDGGFK